MVKLNKYLILMQLFILSLIGQSIIQCAARIQTEKSITALNSELIIAANYGNKEKVMKLIKQGANVDATDEFSDTALIWAANSGNKEMVEFLIKAKADVNAANKKGNTALMGAAINVYKEIVELLIKAGADVDAADRTRGDTALIWSASFGYKEIVKLLIKAKADVNAANKKGNTALTWAIRNGHKEIVELLLKAGANIEHKNLKGNKAIDYTKIDSLDSELTKKNKEEIVIMIEGEPARRDAVIKKWIKEILARKITEATSEQLFSDISNIIAEYYSIEYTNIPLEYRLSN